MLINRVSLESVGSTNTWAKEHVEKWDREALTVITAEEQTAGRGRFKRVWVSPKGCNLYVTYVFFLKKLEISNLPQVLALSVYNVVQNGIGIKWPNDLIMAKKKLGGILCEVVEARGQYAVVLGLGLNINMPFEALKEIDRPATSLLIECGMEWDKSDLSEAIHEEFARNFAQFLKFGFTLFLDPFRKALVHQRGDWVSFSNFEKTITGQFHALNPDGSLALLTQGKIQNYASGELL